MKNKEKVGKWKVAGFGKVEREILYQRLRSKAKGIIVKKYKMEYLKVFKDLREKELKKYIKQNG